MSPGTTAPAFLVTTGPLQFHCHRPDLRNGHNLPSFIPVMHPSVPVEQLWGDSRSIRLNLPRPCSLPAPSPMPRSPPHPPLFLPQLLSVGTTRTLGIVLAFPPPSPTASEAGLSIPVPLVLSHLPDSPSQPHLPGGGSSCPLYITQQGPQLVSLSRGHPGVPLTPPHSAGREIFPKHMTLPCSQPIRAPTGLG